MSTPTALTIPVGGNTSPLIRDIQKAAGSIPAVNLRLNPNGFIQPLGKITSAMNQFDKSIEASNARVLAFGVSAGIFLGIKKSIDSFVTSAIEVEKVLTDINVVLNVSQKDLSKFGRDLVKTANDYGTSFENAGKAAVEFSRQGLGLNETLKRTQAALLLTRLTGLDAAEAVQDLTAALNSFSKSALTAEQLVNKLANVDAAFAVSSKDLAEGIKRVGSTAQDAGVNIDQLIALITTAQQTTARGGAVIGNALKTIFTRASRADTLEQLEQFGITVRNLEGDARPAIEVLKNLASQYDTLAQSQKSQVAEMLGGVYQINILKALVTDLTSANSSYDKALQKSQDTTEGAIEKNKRLNETLAALLQRTKNNATEASSAIGSQALGPGLSFVLNSLNGAFEAISKSKEPEEWGGKLASGVLKGLGDFISGPGLLIGGAAIIKLFSKLASDVGMAAKSILGLKSITQQQLDLQNSINYVLQRNPDLVQQVINKTKTQAQLESEVLAILQLETQERAKHAAIAASVTRSITGGAVTPGVLPAAVATAAGTISGARGSGGGSGSTRFVNPLDIQGVGPNLPPYVNIPHSYPSLITNQNLSSAKNAGLSNLTQKQLQVLNEKIEKIWGISQGMPGNLGNEYKNLYSAAGGMGLNKHHLAFLKEEARSGPARVSAHQVAVAQANDLQKAERAQWMTKMGAIHQESAQRDLERHRSRIENAQVSSLASPWLWSSSRKAQLTSMAGTNPLAAQALEDRRARNATYAGRASLVAGLGVPIATETIANFAFDRQTRENRTKSRLFTSTLNGVAGGAMLGSVAGPYGAAAGAAVGGAAGIFRAIQEWNDIMPEFNRHADEARAAMSQISDSLVQITTVATTLKEAQDNGGLSRKQKDVLANQIRNGTTGLDQNSLNQLLERIEKGDATGSQEFYNEATKTTKRKSLFSSNVKVLADPNSTVRDMVQAITQNAEKGTFSSDALERLRETKNFEGLKQVASTMLGGDSSDEFSKVDLAIDSKAKTEEGRKELMQLIGGLRNKIQTSQRIDEAVEAGSKIKSPNSEEIRRKILLGFQNKSILGAMDSQNSAIFENLDIDKQRQENLTRLSLLKQTLSPNDYALRERDIGISDLEREKSSGISLANRNFADQLSPKLGEFLKEFTKTNPRNFELLKNSFESLQESLAKIQQTGSMDDTIEKIERIYSLVDYDMAVAEGGNANSLNTKSFIKEFDPFRMMIENSRRELGNTQFQIEEKSKNEKELLQKKAASDIAINNLEKLLGFDGTTPNSVIADRTREIQSSMVGNLIREGINPSGNESRLAELQAKKSLGLGFEVDGEELERLKKEIFETNRGPFDYQNSFKSLNNLRRRNGELDARSFNALTDENTKALGALGTPREGAELQDRYLRETAELFKKLNEETISLTTAFERASIIRENIELDRMERDGTIFSSDLAGRRSSNRDRQILNDPTYKPLKGALDSFSETFKYETQDLYKDLKDGAIEVGQTMKSSFKDAFKSFADGSKNAGEALQSLGLGIANKLFDKSIDMGFDSLFGGIQGGVSAYFNNKANGGLIQGYSTGGKVKGGSGVVDDVPARLTKGEYVIRKSSVNKYGEGFLNMLNQGGLAHFANGGSTFRNEFSYNDNKYPTKGGFNISPYLSAEALDDENNPQNALRMAREQNFYSYLHDKDVYDKQKQAAMDAYENAKMQRLIAAGISAANSIGGAGISAGVSSYRFNSAVNNAQTSHYGDIPYKGMSNYAAIGGYATNGGVAHFAKGGSAKDTIPAMVMGGEFIMTKEAVNKYGLGFMNQLNRGTVKGFTGGGLIGNTIPSAPTSAMGSQGSDKMTEIMTRILEAMLLVENNTKTKSSPESKTEDQSSIVANFTTNIKIDKEGNPSSSQHSESSGKNRENEENLKKFVELINANIYKVLQKELRPNGILNPKTRSS